VREAEGKLAETRAQKELASQQVRELEAVHKQQPEKADPSAMAEAQAALRKAENAEQELAKVVTTRKDALDDLKQQIDKTQQMTKNIDRKPDALDDILKDLDGQGTAR
jgi:DNA repair ATPase RecN